MKCTKFQAIGNSWSPCFIRFVANAWMCTCLSVAQFLVALCVLNLWLYVLLHMNIGKLWGDLSYCCSFSFVFSSLAGLLSSLYEQKWVWKLQRRSPVLCSAHFRLSILFLFVSPLSFLEHICLVLILCLFYVAALQGHCLTMHVIIASFLHVINSIISTNVINFNPLPILPLVLSLFSQICVEFNFLSNY
jgi:hypothetical protein